MDYSEEMALQEIEIVKKMNTRNDYMDARDKLLKVQHHFPAIVNISEMIAVCDILCTADFKLLDCGTDWYQVLQVYPPAGETDIGHQYRRITALLEPIKNNFPGTASALKIIQDAFFVLSDPEKRPVFDSKRAASLGAYESVIFQKSCDDLGQSCCIFKTSFQREDNSPSSAMCKGAACETLDGIDDVGCPMQVPSKCTEYVSAVNLLRELEFHSAEVSTGSEVTGEIHVVDERMKKVFTEERNDFFDCKKIEIYVGEERHAGNVASLLESDCPSEKSMASKSCDDEFYDFDNIRNSSVFAVGQVWAVYDEESMPRRYAQINNIEKFPFRLHISWLKPAPVTAHERRWCEVGLPVSCGFFELDTNETTVMETTMFSHMISWLASPLHQRVEIHPKKHEIWAIYKDWKPFKWCSDPKERKSCIPQMVEILTEFSNQVDAMVVCLGKVEGFENVFTRCTKDGNEDCFTILAKDMYIFSHCVPAVRFLREETGTISDTMFQLDPLAIPDDLKNTIETSEKGSSGEYFSLTQCPLFSPATESRKFRWSAEHVASGQIWAVYDGPDCMPRRYVLVNNLISGNEACVTFLEPHPILDDEIHWVEENLPFVSGLFRASRTSLNLRITKFSHLIDCERSAKKSFYKIYPKKGEVWAMYRNWNSRWKQSDISHYRCQIVEIISDMIEDSELKTASLVVVPGCMTFFQRQLSNGFELFRTIPRAEMLSFSHRIVAFTVPGIEKYGIPEGSLHLEPDALPLNFGMQF